MSARASQFAAWRQLLRAANVFTAASNVIAGFLLVQRQWFPLPPLAMLVIASMLLYEAGMVLNDAFDADVDAKERPERPIPSGAVSRRTAFAVGWILLATGCALAWVATWRLQTAAPAVVASCLAISIVLYDSGLKNSWAGALLMGWCRFLNVLLGASAAADLGDHPAAWMYAAAVGVYTVGLTFTAQSEVTADQSTSGKDRAAQTCLLIAPAAILSMPALMYGEWLSWEWVALVVIEFAYLLWSFRRARQAGSPAARRQFVGAMILLFVATDALASVLAAGWDSGLVVFSLLLPALIASRSTAMT